MKASVIIPTYNGFETLQLVISSLLKQTTKDFELIIVNDGSQDQTQQYLDHLEFDGSLKVIHQENSGRSKARNIGARAASNNLLLFLDDDIEASPTLVEQHIAHQVRYPNSILVGSTYISGRHQTDFLSYRRFLEERWYLNLPDYSVPMNAENLFLSSANFSIPCDMFFSIDGFDERLSDAEDFDLGMRLLEGGHLIYFDGAVVGEHLDFTTCQQYIYRKREYAKAHEALQSQSELYNKIKNKPKQRSIRSLIKGAVFLPLAFGFWVRWVDSNNLSWLPKKIRYFLYSAIIGVHSRIV